MVQFDRMALGLSQLLAAAARTKSMLCESRCFAEEGLSMLLAYGIEAKASGMSVLFQCFNSFEPRVTKNRVSLSASHEI